MNVSDICLKFPHFYLELSELFKNKSENIFFPILLLSIDFEYNIDYIIIYRTLLPLI